MKSPVFSLLIFLLIITFGNAQNGVIIINPGINLPQDSIESTLLITSLNDFLSAVQAPNEENEFVLTSEKIETFILLDEIHNIQKSRKYEDDYFYKPYLTNLIGIEDEKHLLQISYIGITENTPLLRASFEIIASKIDDHFLFSSPLLRNTKNWKISITPSTIFHYKDSINQENLVEYSKGVALFDKKLHSTDKTAHFYCCKDRVELLKLIGVEYKVDYNGKSTGAFNSVFENEKLIVSGDNNAHFDQFDLHDLWHDRLSLVISRRLVNQPIDEACAYLYGGSWGLSWKEILSQFMTKVASKKDADWADFKENQTNFGDSQAEHLMVDYVVNALIIQKLEKEQGFSAVWELLNCGKYEKGNDNYYQVLEKLTGITKSNYNEEVWALINKI